ncbi:MAG: hypothetical protein JWN88_1264 [Frankiales bacterium]|nr:hypothetical protein [Frankiales bacterium]
MSESPASPRASRLSKPGWLDGRLLLGVLLVLVSVVVGARTLSAADQSSLVWATTTDIALGSQLSAADVAPVRVRLYDNVDRYLDATGPAPVGYVVRRGLGAGELLPDDALVMPEDEAFRLVTVPVEAGHFPPDLADEQEVDVWISPPRPGGGGAGAASAGTAAGQGTDPDAPLELSGAQEVLTRVAVASGPPAEAFRSGSTTSPVVLRVRKVDVGRLVSAMSLGRIDLVRVPRNAEVNVPRGTADSS